MEPHHLTQGEALTGDAFSMMNDPQSAKALLLKYFNVDYDSLKPHSNKPSDKQVNFFVEYPETHKEEYEVLIKFLHAVNTKYYSSFQKGDWENFANNMTAGVVLVRKTNHPPLFRTSLTFSI